MPCFICGGEVVPTKRFFYSEIVGKTVEHTDGFHCTTCFVRFERMPPPKIEFAPVSEDVFPWRVADALNGELAADAESMKLPPLVPDVVPPAVSHAPCFQCAGNGKWFNGTICPRCEGTGIAPEDEDEDDDDELTKIVNEVFADNPVSADKIDAADKFFRERHISLAEALKRDPLCCPACDKLAFVLDRDKIHGFKPANNDGSIADQGAVLRLKCCHCDHDWTMPTLPKATIERLNEVHRRFSDCVGQDERAWFKQFADADKPIEVKRRDV